MRTLIDVLKSEKESNYQGGIYHKLQIDFAYNTNHIEGSRLTHEQTRYIFETNTIGVENNGAININDIYETVNHFRCFDYIIDTYEQPLNECYVKELHRLLKAGVVDKNAVIGEYKVYPNSVGLLETVLPANVPYEMNNLFESCSNEKLSLYDIADFHVRYESIHPFYDGNGRTGRLIMFKQCLDNDVLPFIVDDRDKIFYYKGLSEWQMNDNSERLISVFLDAQDRMEAVLNYFEIDYSRSERTYAEALKNGKGVLNQSIDKNRT